MPRGGAGGAIGPTGERMDRLRYTLEGLEEGTNPPNRFNIGKQLRCWNCESTKRMSFDCKERRPIGGGMKLTGGAAKGG